MLTRATLKRQLDSLPEQFSIDNGNRQSKNGEIISETDLNKEIEQWFK